MSHEMIHKSNALEAHGLRDVLLGGHSHDRIKCRPRDRTPSLTSVDETLGAREVDV